MLDESLLLLIHFFEHRPKDITHLADQKVKVVSLDMHSLGVLIDILNLLPLV